MWRESIFLPTGRFCATLIEYLKPEYFISPDRFPFEDRIAMKLKETDIHELGQMFEEGLNRMLKADKREKLRFRRRIRDELFAMLGWELASPSGIVKRFEERMPDFFQQVPYGFKDELLTFLNSQMSTVKGLKDGKSEVQMLRERRQAATKRD
jgi:hypothetical protein